MSKGEDKYKEEIEEILEDSADLPEIPSVDWRNYRPLSEEIASWYRRQRSSKHWVLGPRKGLFAAIFFIGLFVLTIFYLFALLGLAFLGLFFFLFLFKNK